jgi:hypothetical protein
MPFQPVTATRGGTAVFAGVGGVDMNHSVLYLRGVADVRDGDVLTFGGESRRVIKEPESWFGAGLVVSFEPSYPLLRDLGALSRQNGTTFDRALNTEVPTWQTLWSGPCLVDPPTIDGSATDAEVAQQMLTVQPFTVSVPLEVVDIRPDDRFIVTRSDDPWMVGRPLQVTRVKGASLAQQRQFTAISNEG